MAAEKKRSVIMLKLFIKRLQNHLHLSRKLDKFKEFEHGGSDEVKESVPGDVKEGHFAVLAAIGEEKPIRFVVELSVLKHPAFLRLLKMAEEDYGFQHRGALQVPCQPEELRRVLQDKTY